VGERYLEALAKHPPDESIAKQIVPAAVKSTLQGIKVLSISEVQEAKLDAAYDRAVNMMVMFHSIEGFGYTVEIFMKVEEAMAAIGMKVE
jgi:hypothetical protein